MPERQNMTELIRAMQAGDKNAEAEIAAIIHAELRKTAHAYMIRERSGHTLQATELVHETYLRLRRMGTVEIGDRHHFYALSARSMRRILFEYGRDRVRPSRRADQRVPMPDRGVAAPDDSAQTTVRAAIEDLRRHDPTTAEAVELRYYEGLSREEISERLGVAPATVGRLLHKAKDRLSQGLGGGKL